MSSGVGDEASGRSLSRHRIIDYKTGRALPKSRLRRDLQLALYALGAQTLLDQDGGTADGLELEIVYLRDGHREVIEATKELLDEARRIGGEVAAAIRAGRFEPHPELKRCSRCSYRLVCEAAL